MYALFFLSEGWKISLVKVPYKRKAVKIKNFSGEDVDALYFNSQRDLKTAAEELDKNGVACYESDVDPVRRYLMERFLNSQIMLQGNRNLQEN